MRNENYKDKDRKKSTITTFQWKKDNDILVDKLVIPTYPKNHRSGSLLSVNPVVYLVLGTPEGFPTLCNRWFADDRRQPPDMRRTLSTKAYAERSEATDTAPSGKLLCFPYIANVDITQTAAAAEAVASPWARHMLPLLHVGP